MKRIAAPSDFASNRQNAARARPIEASTEPPDVRFFFLATPSILGGGYFWLA